MSKIIQSVKQVFSSGKKAKKISEIENQAPTRHEPVRWQA